MLWVDEDFVTVADLNSIDAEVVEVAATENLVLASSTGMGLIRRAKEDCQNTLSRFMSLRDLSPRDLTLRDINIPVSSTSDLMYNYAGFAQLVVTGDTEMTWGALKSWVVYRTLAKIYRAATNKQSDRYSDRHDAMKDEVRAIHWPNLKRRGLPICFNPLPAPGAISERAGLFNTDSVVLVTAAGTVSGDYDVALTWVGPRYVSPTQKFNQESGRSARVTANIETGEVLRVSIEGLTPPNGTQPAFTRSSCRYSPGVAVGWNVWAGLAGDTLYRQNAAVLPLTQAEFQLPGNPILTGEVLGLGQYDDIVLAISTELELA